MLFEFTILGTSSQGPTLDRGQGGYLVRWADEMVLFDPGEGCQRQMIRAGVSPAAVTRVCVTHFHGDHCLGLPGFLQSRALVTSTRVGLYFPASGQPFVDHLLCASAIDFDLRVDQVPLVPGQTVTCPHFDMSAVALDHPEPAIGYRLEGREAWHLVPELLAGAGLSRDDIAELGHTGHVKVGDRLIDTRELSERRKGPTLAFIMDTRYCAGLSELAADADVVVCEATYLDAEADLAKAHGHLTARQAATLAADHDVGLLVLSHFSSRYDDLTSFEDEAQRVFPSTVVARDLTCIAYLAKTRRTSPASDTP